MDTVNNTATNAFFNPEWCSYRLPCGYCTRLEKPCPMQKSTTITYTSGGLNTGFIMPDTSKGPTCQSNDACDI